jgi:drug/metabolite transporter (DMT)-like permease
MPDKLRGLMDRNILTAIAAIAAVACLLIAFGAAVTGHYDSASVRAFIDDIKWIAGVGLFGTAIGRGLLAAGQRIGDGHTEAILAQAQLRETAAAPPAEAAPPQTPPLQPSQTDVISS